MAYQILSTKLYIPPIQPNLVRRPRLIQHLESGYQNHKRLSLISAPAGFGKTTIVREWITSVDSGKPFSWLSLDDGDNDPVRFLIYLVSAIQKVHTEIGQSVLSLLQSSQVTMLTDLVETLINEISLANNPFLIVLDDYHLIKKTEVHSLMQLFLKRHPDQLHWVIITREDPPIPLPRMRVEGQITEIRERDLRFTLAESKEFLVQTMRLELSEDDVEKLEERTEGWAAGMQLAGLALEEFTDKSERRTFIEAFAGSNRLIVDYLISEVLQRQSEDARQFLLRTSILDRFCAELCDQIVFENSTGSSQSIIEALEKSNMFIVPLDSQRHWYRYHHLFSEMLLYSLKHTFPDLILTLHLESSKWFERNGFIPEAVKHAIASQNWEHVNGLLNRYALAIIFPGFVRLVIDWCRQIPRSYLEKAPDICIYYAWALVLTFREDYMATVEEYLQLAEKALQRTDLPEFAPVGEGRANLPLRDWAVGQIAVIRSQILLGHLYENIDPQEEIALSQKGLDLLPETELLSRSICRINLALAESMQNHPIEAQKAFEDVMPMCLQSRNFLSAVTASFYLSRLALYTQSVDQSEMVCQYWKKVVGDIASSSRTDTQSLAEVPALRGLDIVQGMIFLERNQINEAEKLFIQSLEMVGWASWMELHGFVELARLQFQRGDDTSAKETLNRMYRLGPQHTACATALNVWFDLKRSPYDEQSRSRADTWIKLYTPNPAIPLALGIGPYHRDTEYVCNLIWARVQILLGNYTEASRFLSPALEIAHARSLLFREAELSIAKSLLESGLGNSSAALSALSNALAISETCKYSRFFHDGPELDRLLKQAIDKKIHPQYARQLLASVDKNLSSSRPTIISFQVNRDQTGLIDPLSERELEVLRLLAEGLSLAEVAKRLFLSPFTLKAHTHNIYTKLDVHNRVEAINKASALGLI